jgi:ribonuclease VapC
MFVDASAIIAILTGEPEGEELAARLEQPQSDRITSVLAVWEAVVGLYRKKRLTMGQAEAHVRDFLEQAGVEVVPVSTVELSAALAAFDLHGRHRYPESERNRGLNLADCFHYACAKSRDLPVLHKDPGFASTDIRNAMKGGDRV